MGGKQAKGEAKLSAFISPFVVAHLAFMCVKLRSCLSAPGRAAVSKLSACGVAQGHKRRQTWPGASKAVAHGKRHPATLCPGSACDQERWWDSHGWFPACFSADASEHVKQIPADPSTTRHRGAGLPISLFTHFGLFLQ